MFAVKAPDNRYYLRAYAGHPAFTIGSAKALQMTAAAAERLARKLHTLGYPGARAVAL